jgi:hypothetical protein
MAGAAAGVEGNIGGGVVVGRDGQAVGVPAERGLCTSGLSRVVEDEPPITPSIRFSTLGSRS